MRKIRYLALTGAFSLLIAFPLQEDRRPIYPAVELKTEQMKRGAYIAHHVAMCVHCHSTRDDEGNVTRLFHGGRIPMKAPDPGMEWAFRAPHLAGLAGYSKENFLHLLTTGKRLDGREPRLPMPPFRLSREDAEAVYEYLKSLR